MAQVVPEYEITKQFGKAKYINSVLNNTVVVENKSLLILVQEMKTKGIKMNATTKYMTDHFW